MKKIRKYDDFKPVVMNMLNEMNNRNDLTIVKIYEKSVFCQEEICCKSTFQRVINQLVTDGYLKKEPFSKSHRVSITSKGKVYLSKYREGYFQAKAKNLNLQKNLAFLLSSKNPKGKLLWNYLSDTSSIDRRTAEVASYIAIETNFGEHSLKMLTYDDISASTNIPVGSLTKIVQTLMDEGLIDRAYSDGNKCLFNYFYLGVPIKKDSNVMNTTVEKVKEISMNENPMEKSSSPSTKNTSKIRKAIEWVLNLKPAVAKYESKIELLEKEKEELLSRNLELEDLYTATEISMNAIGDTTH